MNSKLWYTLAVGAFLCLSAAQLHSEDKFTDSLETAFVDGGQISINLSAGEHTISESPDNLIRVFWRVKDEHKKQEVDASTDVDGSTATIDLDGPRNNFRTVIQIPRNSDLIVRLSAGELEVGNVAGDKDIRLRAGNLRIAVEDIHDYATVKGSLWAGDIDSGPFGEEVSGLFRSIDWEGEGEHKLRFKLMAGDVQLYQKTTPE
jgi:hypothetical protein